jgi:hypothetical protein
MPCHITEDGAYTRISVRGSQAWRLVGRVDRFRRATALRRRGPLLSDELDSFVRLPSPWGLFVTTSWYGVSLVVYLV